MQLVYEGNWHTYEEWGSIRIFEDCGGCFHAQTGGHSVYSSGGDPEWEEIYVISFETALDLIDEWDKIEIENEKRWSKTYEI